MKTALDRDPTITPARLFLAFVYEQTGRKEEARAEVTEFLKLNPDYSQKVLWETAPVKDPATLEMIAEALRKAGLE
ncbi:MAG: hypothetical protein JRK53_02640 [Deltaproteobacteria bacterium]|nr:hypothetical protein [Deltaproteobacteria bacterium]MBW1816306.1 hypothetical protein [Deltaproteobacteria bacterium]